jgi:hypothetical protein
MIVLWQGIPLWEKVTMQNCKEFIYKAVAYPMHRAKIHEKYGRSELRAPGL